MAITVPRTDRTKHLDFLPGVVLIDPGLGLLEVGASPVLQEVGELVGGDVVNVEHAAQHGAPLLPHHLPDLFMEPR